MNVHFIAIGGAVMHNLAIVLRRKGHQVTGSDDKIVDPAKANLEKEGILPPRIGFFTENVTSDLDAVILGMHARADNPELLKAQELGLKIYSFPEYLYEVSKNKKRVVIAGSHGKTSITSMVMHVLKVCGYDFDYMVGAKVKGFDTGVKITESAPLIILEGDEYLASPVNPESKFMFYKPHIALLTGVAWDHVNVFPDYGGYVNQFRKFANSVEPGGYITWYKGDKELQEIFGNFSSSVEAIPYDTHPSIIHDQITYLRIEDKPTPINISAEGNSDFVYVTGISEIPLKVFGDHNLQNIAGAKNVCAQLGVNEMAFCNAISSFEGAANRLQFIGKNDHTVIYKDFAHSPSKLKATVEAMKHQFVDKSLVAVMELHTFSSLNKDFVKQYEGTMNAADIPVVFYDRETFEHKKMPVLEEDFVKQAFNNQKLQVFTNPTSLNQFLTTQDWNNKNLLLMTSGNFAGMNLNDLSTAILNN